MTSHPPTFSLRCAALAVTTITVAFSAGDAKANDFVWGASSTPANDAAPATVRAFERQAVAELAPVVDPYADPLARGAWQSKPSAALLPVARVVEASANGYVVQIGGYRDGKPAVAISQTEVARLGPVRTRL